MKPGIYYSLPMSEYQAIRAANKSGLDCFHEATPLHYWANFLDPEREVKKPTPALRLGSAIHTAILEPERYEREYRIKPEPEMYPGCLVTLDDYKTVCKDLGLKVSGTKDVLKSSILTCLRTKGIEPPAFFDDIEEKYFKGGFQLIAKKEAQIVARIASAVRTSKAAKLLLGAGKSEVTLVWEDPQTKVLCKARADWLTDSHDVMIDFKSTVDANPSSFSRSAAQYGYHRQAAWYLEGLKQVTGKDLGTVFVFPVYETSTPFANAFYYASQKMVAQGHAENRRLLKQYAECLAKNEWPGYSQMLENLDLPAWAVSDINEGESV